jgi:hypothetical protein
MQILEAGIGKSTSKREIIAEWIARRKRNERRKTELKEKNED